MSRIGKMPIVIPEGVTVKIDGGKITFTGQKGEVILFSHPKVKVESDGKQIICFSKDNTLWGLTRSLIANAVLGVSDGWSKTLELVGVGFRAETTGKELILNIGFSHPVKIQAPEGITFKVGENKVEILGADKQAVGELTAQIRRIKPPEPYKGKGIKYQGEIIRRKLGKAAKAIGGAGPASGGASGGKK